MLVALLVVGLMLIVRSQESTKSVLLKIDVDLKDPSLVFLLDDAEISAAALAGPLDLTFGEHELVVLRDAEPIYAYRFPIDRDTPEQVAPQPVEPEAVEPGVPSGAVAEAVPSDQTRQEQRRKGQWVQLFNGKDLSGWRMRPQTPGNWHVDNGILICDGGQHGHLFTVENDWTDVQVRLEARFSGANTGIGFRALFSATPWAHCYHVDLGPPKSRPTGSLIGGIRQRVLVNEQHVDPDTWFTMEVIIQGHHIVTKINDQIVVDHEDTRKRVSEGHLVLTHTVANSTIQFKRIEVRDLAQEKLPARVD